MGEENKEILLSDQEFLEACKEAGLGESLDQYTTRVSDKRVSEGIKTREKNLQAKNLTDSEKIVNLETELSEIKSKNAKGILNNSIKKALKEADLGEGFASYIRVEKEEDIENAVKDLKENILEQKQESINEKLKEGEPPLKGDKTFTGTGSMETAVKDYAEEINPKEK